MQIQTQNIAPNTMRMRLEADGVESRADDLTAEDMKDLFNVLRGQTEGMLALDASVKENTTVLHAI